MTLMVQLPDAVEQRLRARAKAQGQPVEELAASLLTSLADTTPATSEDWLDKQYHAECEADTSPEISVEEVRRILAKIPGSMTPDFIAERDE
jgi:plasmid stability protein